MPVPAAMPGDGGVDERDFAGLALDAVAEDERREPGGAGDRSRRFERLLRRRDDAVLDARETGIAWLRRLVVSPPQMRENRRRPVDAVFLQYGEGVGGRGRIGDGRA